MIHVHSAVQSIGTITGARDIRAASTPTTDLADRLRTMLQQIDELDARVLRVGDIMFGEVPTTLGCSAAQEPLIDFMALSRLIDRLEVRVAEISNHFSRLG